MTDSTETYVTDDMRATRDVWSESQTSLPIAASDIRKWAIATFWPEPPPRVYWDEAHANTTQWGGIIAPPDFNPFAWPVARSRGHQPAGKRPDGKAFTGMNGGQTDTYGVPMRPGDVVTTRSRLVDWTERTGRFGLTLYTTTEIEWRNQNEDLVKRRMSIGIRY